jgi:hypothetical protein
MPVGKPDNPYRESDTHVPDPTHQTSVLDTTELGGNGRIQDVTPIFAETAKADLVEAAEILESGDPLRSGNVILPDPIYPDLRKEAKEDLLARAEEHREGDYVSPVEAQKQNFLAGAAPAGGDRVVSTTPAGTGSGTSERPSDGNTQLAGAPEGSGVRLAVEETLGKGDSGSTGSDSGGSDSGSGDAGPTEGEGSKGGGKYADLLAKGNEAVQQYMDAHPDEAGAIKAEERGRTDGKPVRAGIVNYTPRPKSS